MSERNLSYEINCETLSKIFICIDESLNKKINTDSNLIINNSKIVNKVKLTKVSFNKNNPYLSKINLTKNESFTNNKTS